MKHLVLLLLLLFAVAALAQVPGRTETGQALDAATRALEATNRNLARWFIVVIVAIVMGAGIAVWRIWGYSAKLTEIDAFRNTWDRRFAELSDELLRTKRRLADLEGGFSRVDGDFTALRTSISADAPDSYLARLEKDVAALREGLANVEARIDVTAGQYGSVESVVNQRVSGAARAAADAGRQAARAVALLSAAVALRRSDEALARGDNDEALVLCTGALESLAGHEPDGLGLGPAALANRCTAYLRTGNHNAALADAGRLAAAAGPDPKPAARAQLLSGVARLYGGAMEEGLAAIGRALELDPNLRGKIVGHPDVGRWLAANRRHARVFRRGLRRLEAAAKPRGTGRRRKR